MKVDVDLVNWATECATMLLSPLDNRWLHVQGVVKRANQVGKVLSEDDRPYLIAAAYLHDIGYAPSLKKTGFHPLDGVNYLRSLGHERLASLVAHHSGACFEAQLRGYAIELNTFPRERSATADALTYCDLTTGHLGELVTLKERTQDIFYRYGDSDIVSQAFRQARPYVSLAVARTKLRLQKCGLSENIS